MLLHWLWSFLFGNFQLGKFKGNFVIKNHNLHIFIPVNRVESGKTLPCDIQTFLSSWKGLTQITTFLVTIYNFVCTKGLRTKVTVISCLTLGLGNILDSVPSICNLWRRKCDFRLDKLQLLTYILRLWKKNCRKFRGLCVKSQKSTLKKVAPSVSVFPKSVL